MTTEENQKYVLLNRLVSRATSRAPDDCKPPMTTANEALAVISARMAKKWAIEFPTVPDRDRDEGETEDQRIARCKGNNFIWLRQMQYIRKPPWEFCVLLFEYVDASKASFSVVDIDQLTGREISGRDNERGSVSAHVVIRLPIKQYDDGSYRCGIEAARNIPRLEIERFLCRQLRRWSSSEGLVFSVNLIDKKGRSNEKNYRYNPRLELFSDIGRRLDFVSGGGRELTHMTFTKRSTKQALGKKTSIDHQDIIADVELKISAKQGPSDTKKRTAWLVGVRKHFELQGYETRMYYRHISGGMMSGEVHQALAGATDLVMCQKELISVAHAREWYSKISDDVAERIISLLNTDELWERSK